MLELILLDDNVTPNHGTLRKLIYLSTKVERTYTESKTNGTHVVRLSEHLLLPATNTDSAFCPTVFASQFLN